MGKGLANSAAYIYNHAEQEIIIYTLFQGKAVCQVLLQLR